MEVLTGLTLEVNWIVQQLHSAWTSAPSSGYMALPSFSGWRRRILRGAESSLVTQAMLCHLCLDFNEQEIKHFGFGAESQECGSPFFQIYVPITGQLEVSHHKRENLSWPNTIVTTGRPHHHTLVSPE